MGHRHPSTLRNSEVGHARARWLLRAELACCTQCRAEGDREAVADLSVNGMFDSLIVGFVLARLDQWSASSAPPRYPAVFYTLAPVDERDFWQPTTQHCMRVCVVKKASPLGVETFPVLRELRLMPMADRGRVLDDIVDGLCESESPERS
ncbi:hypothetical protein [Nocardiopsis sp. CNT312]|uniref:hypothetical protein n=1 Tax=Nocardiopsis sp. CNT312 TaxID=1137268 RepID=UPI0004919BC1|nr:hypothetical protein [Nocardiopsis sp. CNT312]